MENQPVVLERTFDAPIQRVWAALTDNEKMKQWYFSLPEFRPEVGFEFNFLAGADGKEFLHLCKVTEVIPGKKIAYSWQYENNPGNSEVAFELFEEGDKTRLLLTHAGLETFGNSPDFAKNNFINGWTYFMDDALKGFLSGQ